MNKYDLKWSSAYFCGPREKILVRDLKKFGKQHRDAVDLSGIKLPVLEFPEMYTLTLRLHSRNQGFCSQNNYCR